MPKEKPKRTFHPTDFHPQNYTNHSRQLCSIVPFEPPQKGTPVERYDGWRWLEGYRFQMVLPEQLNGREIWRLQTVDEFSVDWPADRIRKA